MDSFRKIISDFTNDLNHVFPEFKIYEQSTYAKLREDGGTIETIYDHCKKTFPDKFFDIMYEKAHIFDEEIFLMPDIDFALVWKSNLTPDTREKVWKYLQMILFAVIQDVDAVDEFGDSSKLFELLDESNLKDKIYETFQTFESMFGVSGETPEHGISNELPFNPEDINAHMSTLFEGKIGKLAKEIADDTLQELNIDSSANMNDLFASLVQEPKKLMNLVEKISKNLDAKIKHGEIDKDELMGEASELLKNMKNMPGMEEMFKKMAKKHTGGKGKVPSLDTMDSLLKNKMKSSQQRTKMLERLNKKKEGASATEKDSPDLIADIPTEHSIDEVMKSFLDDEQKPPAISRKKKHKRKQS